MTTKLAADLERGDAVLVAPGDRRVVEKVEFRDQPIAAGESCTVRVWWFGRTGTNLLSPTKELTITE
jgi:hypothetical protein